MRRPPAGSAGFGRRSVVRGAAWSVPVIAVGAAAPATAASNCSAVTFAWLNPGAGRPVRSSFTTGTAGSVTVTAAITGPNAAGANNTISPDAGGYNGYASYYEQELTGSATNSSVPLSTTLLFSQPVRNLAFTFFDIDQDDRTTDPAYIDAVAITSHTSAAGDFSYVNGPVVVGTGTAQDNWRARQGTGQINGQEGNVAVTFQVPVTGFTWTFRDLTDRDGPGHFIGLTNLRFTPTSC